ncbi:MAG: phytoene desaturase family protein [Beijerinckiaceae bacterium]
MAQPQATGTVAVIGAGIGGLAAAIDLARCGFRVVVLERAAHVGGKMRCTPSALGAIDAGPTVLTMKRVFEELFADAGVRLEDRLTLRPLEILARHAWQDGSRLDLFADARRTEDAIGVFAGAAEARGYRRFNARARRTFAALEHSFIDAPRPGPFELVRRCAPHALGDLLGINPFGTLWDDLAHYFSDVRLRQLFGRYATYCGASPFLAPATLMLIAHVEQAGVWSVEGGMYRLADALQRLATEAGVRFRFGAHVREIDVSEGRARAVVLEDGERIDVAAVVSNADAAALAAGAFGARAAAALRMRNRSRSLSALTLACAGRAGGFDLVRHNVFFGADYADEFDAIFRRGRLPANPTVYLCAQDRCDRPDAAESDERLFWLVNAPPAGDEGRPNHEEIELCRKKATAVMESCGLTIEPAGPETITGPTEFNEAFPGSGGALYGQATHGWRASFQRPGSRTRIPGLYLAGGGAHPGAGVPIAAISGRLAAQALMADLASHVPSRRAATRGGMSTRSAMTGNSA